MKKHLPKRFVTYTTLIKVSETVLSVLKKTTEYFASIGIDRPRLQAEWLLAHLLKISRLNVYLQFEAQLSDAQLSELRQYVVRRANREPLQYILGNVEFCNCTLDVDKRCLIPRPETEDWVHNLLETRAAPSSVLELGTGSGAIAIAVAKKFPETRIVAVDNNPETLALARDNAQKNNVFDHIQWVESSWFDKVTGTFDWILSNPPYLTPKELETVEPEIRDYEPHGALVAAENGLADLKYIFTNAHSFLNPNGLLAVEIGATQGKIIADVARNLGYSDIQCIQDLCRRDRVVQCVK